MNPRQRYVADITREEYRAQWKEKQKKLSKLIRELKAANKFSLPEILEVHMIWLPVNVDKRIETTDNDIELQSEKFYVGA